MREQDELLKPNGKVEANERLSVVFHIYENRLQIFRAVRKHIHESRTNYKRGFQLENHAAVTTQPI